MKNIKLTDFHVNLFNICLLLMIVLLFIRHNYKVKKETRAKALADKFANHVKHINFLYEKIDKMQKIIDSHKEYVFENMDNIQRVEKGLYIEKSKIRRLQKQTQILIKKCKNNNIK
ncbi:MAG: hypothetical protein RR411_10300 [Chryseobacterium sp.]|uniref:hypothetical protein n=1 Tax=Chryseobacterium sp. TaxID=1871047 RepID=UPI002FCB4B13